MSLFDRIEQRRGVFGGIVAQEQGAQPVRVHLRVHPRVHLSSSREYINMLGLMDCRCVYASRMGLGRQVLARPFFAVRTVSVSL